MNVRYLTPVCLGRISHTAGPLCTSLTNTLLGLAQSRHNDTLPLALGIRTKLL